MDIPHPIGGGDLNIKKGLFAGFSLYQINIGVFV